MENFKEKNEPMKYENINHNPDFFKLSRGKIRIPTNQDTILDFLSKLNLNIRFHQDEQENNSPMINSPMINSPQRIVSRAKNLNIVIKLEQMSQEYIDGIEAEKEIKEKPMNEEEEEEENQHPNKGDVSKKEKTLKKTFENSIASINHDEMHEVLKEYKHHQNEMFQVPLHKTYFLNNRIEFLDSIQSKIDHYLEHRKKMNNTNNITDSCDSSSKEGGFSPLIHQDVVKQYLNASSPYRGLLLFHGLGSGKTCSSIGIVEALKQTKKHIYIMTPASLKKNYQTQMMFCGNELFRKTEKWEFVEYPSDDTREEFINQVHKLTGLSLKYLKKKSGIYLIKKGTFVGEYDRSRVKEKELEEQIQLMMEKRFRFISYNGITAKKWLSYYKNNKKSFNPFNNSTVVIDEVHNFVSRILNKLNIKQSSVSTEIYKDLICAENCNVVALTGTPLINYPCELGVLFNIVGGSNVMIELACTHKNLNKKTTKQIKESLKSLQLIDHIEFELPSRKLKNKKYGLLKILKNPYGFIKDPSTGEIQYDFEKGNITNSQLFRNIEKELLKAGYEVDKHYNKNTINYKRFPDTEEEFNKDFIANGQFVKKSFFQNKIVGYVSYIGDKRELMPDVEVPSEDDLVDKYYKDTEIFVEEIPMTKNVLYGYNFARSIEKDMDSAMKKSNKSKDKQTSSYQIFSRAACNFVFPKNIERPYPKGREKMNEDDLEVYTDEEKTALPDGRYEKKEEETKDDKAKRYKEAIQLVLTKLEKAPHNCFESDIPKLIESINLEFQPRAQGYEIDMTPTATNQLNMYSPKFYKLLQNIMNVENNGIHLLYSNFRTLEGIGIFKLILDYYGYTELKFKKENMGSSDVYKLDFDHPYYTNRSFFDKSKPAVTLMGRKFYALYTGKETVEDKEIIRNIINGNLSKIPASLRDDIVERFYGGNYKRLEGKHNLHGELIQLLIISASGAEGIDLKNVRYVHIMEPYWHPVRIIQVIGRARRICSHSDLPEDEQTVKVYMYLLTHNQDLLSSEYGSQFTGLKEVQDYDRVQKRVISTDERLYLIMNRKKALMEEFLHSLKISSIDCRVNYEEKDKCFSFAIKPPGIDYTKDKKNIIQVTKQSNNNRGVEV